MPAPSPSDDWNGQLDKTDDWNRTTDIVIGAILEEH